MMTRILQEYMVYNDNLIIFFLNYYISALPLWTREFVRDVVIGFSLIKSTPMITKPQGVEYTRLSRVGVDETKRVSTWGCFC